MSDGHNMNDDEKKLPWPAESDPQNVGNEFADPSIADRRKVGEAYADPNSLDDRRVGHNFEDANSSAKKHHKPLSERVPKPANRRPLYIGLMVFAVIFLLVLLVGGLPKLFERREINKQAEQEKDAKPTVNVVRVARSTAQAGLALPGTSIPLNEAYVYARASGYLQSYKVDIGDHVHKGQLLAVVDAPDLDAQVAQAREQLRQSQSQVMTQKAQLALDTVTVQRYRVLVTKGVFSRQQGDQQEAAYAQSEANVAAAQRNVDAFKANLDRVLSLQSYEYVRAPFDGVVTQRNVDVGALISSGGQSSGGITPAPMGQTSSAGGTAQAASSNSGGSSGSTSTAATSAQSPGQGGPLFGIAQMQKLRVLVSVPEGYAPFIHVGAKAQCQFQEYPGRVFEGDVTRTAASVDQNTRTMLTEVQVDNKDRKLLSGMYVVTTFPAAPDMKPPIVIAGDAIAIRKDRSTVALVKDGKIHLVPVTIGRDLGNVVEITSGLQEGDTIVTTIDDDVTEGREVNVQMEKSAAQKPTAAPSQSAPPGGSTRYSDQAITDRNVMGEQQQQNQQSQGKGKGEPQKSSQSASKP
ncbi:MAG: efflux RND transporter periplasmic adaptor subunit [Acidobacteriaceae bacterium]|nr:efflux RND transporter periplasmic adaptor subunit [Acidobacteriaceae bacterium]